MQDPETQPSETGAMSGTLFLVGTPIGNLDDLSPRAKAVLAQVDRVAAEDTRRTLQLLNHLQLRKKLSSYHEHNWKSAGPRLLAELKAGKNIALVSDAGMPVISDPGSPLVRECQENGILVTPIPGPCAAITALSVSAMSADRFVFEGFLPTAKKERVHRISSLEEEARTMVFYEAPHRLKRTLQDWIDAGLADRRLTLARELTKKHETILYETVAKVRKRLETEKPRGEYVLILEGREAYDLRVPSCKADMADETVKIDAATRRIQVLVESGMSLSDAARAVAAETGLRKNLLYQAFLQQSERE